MNTLHIRVVHIHEHLATALVSFVTRHPDQDEGTPPKPPLSLALSSGLYNHTYVDMRNTLHIFASFCPRDLFSSSQKVSKGATIAHLPWDLPPHGFASLALSSGL